MCVSDQHLPVSREDELDGHLFVIVAVHLAKVALEFHYGRWLLFRHRQLSRQICERGESKKSACS